MYKLIEFNLEITKSNNNKLKLILEKEFLTMAKMYYNGDANRSI